MNPTGVAIRIRGLLVASHCPPLTTTNQRTEQRNGAEERHESGSEPDE